MRIVIDPKVVRNARPSVLWRRTVSIAAPWWMWSLREAIRVRRYLCRGCKRTVSLLPEFALPYLRFSVAVISLFLVARLLEGRTLRAAAPVAAQPDMPYQRGQFWIRRFRQQAAALGRGVGRVDGAPMRGRLRDSCSADAARHRLHRGAPIPVWPVADAPVGVAAVSGSGRSSGQPAARRSSRLSTNTQHLSGGEGRGWLPSGAGRFARWTPKPKKSLCSVMPWWPRWCWKLCHAENSPGAPKRSPPASTRSRPPSAPRFLSIPCSSGLCVTVTAASKPWPPNLGRTGDSRAPSSPQRWPN